MHMDTIAKLNITPKPVHVSKSNGRANFSIDVYKSLGGM
jgi:hypothetical protein